MLRGGEDGMSVVLYGTRRAMNKLPDGVKNTMHDGTQDRVYKLYYITQGKEEKQMVLPQ